MLAWAGSCTTAEAQMSSANDAIPVVTSVIPGDGVTILHKYTGDKPSHPPMLGHPPLMMENDLPDPGWFSFTFSESIPDSIKAPFFYTGQLISNWIQFIDHVNVSVNIDFESDVFQLASAGVSNWTAIEGAAYPVLYPQSLARQIATGVPDGTDIHVNAYFFDDHWYFGLDGNCPSNRFDLVSVLCHEILHGMGFDNRLGATTSGDFILNSLGIYDYFLADSAGNGVWSTDLYELPEVVAMYTDELYFSGPFTSAILDTIPLLYTPNPWENGSSVAHLDLDLYYGTPNDMMTPGIAAGDVRHSPGEIGIGMLADMGYNINFAPGCLDPTACNYDENAAFDNGSCEYTEHCLDPYSCNYNPDGICHNIDLCSGPTAVYIPNDYNAGDSAIYIPCGTLPDVPEGYHEADPYCAWQVLLADDYCAETAWDWVCQNLYSECACSSYLYDPNEPVELDFSSYIFNDPLVVYCDEYYDGIYEEIVEELINEIEVIDECPEHVWTQSNYEWTPWCGPYSGMLTVYLFYIDIHGEVTPWTGHVSIVDVGAPTLNAFSNITPPDWVPDEPNYLPYTFGLLDDLDSPYWDEYFSNFMNGGTFQVTDNCVPQQEIDDYTTASYSILGMVYNEGYPYVQVQFTVEDDCGNVTSAIYYIYGLSENPDCAWYLPSSVTGPAIFSCDPVPGYEIAINQACVESVTYADNFCLDGEWDSICQNLYEACDEGCTDSEACNYSPNALTDDGSCIEQNWLIPIDPSADLPVISACPSFGIPEGYLLPNQPCVEFILNDDSYCADTAWDNICNDAYLICLGTLDGCSDESACNFDPEGPVGTASCLYPGDACSEADGCNDVGHLDADCACIIELLDSDGDGICDGEEVEGCMNPEALNYDPEATDEGFCEIPGCKESTACNFDPQATLDDGSCIWPGEPCIIETSCEYEAYLNENCECTFVGLDPDSNGNGICDFDEVLGCTDPEACNFNPEAAVNDGSCDYESCADCPEDIDGDGIVAINDLLTLLSNFGCTGNGCAGDIDGDGSTTVNDILALLSSFGGNC